MFVDIKPSKGWLIQARNDTPAMILKSEKMSTAGVSALQSSYYTILLLAGMNILHIQIYEHKAQVWKHWKSPSNLTLLYNAQGGFSACREGIVCSIDEPI